MKRFFAMLLALSMLFAIAACGANNGSETADTAGNSAGGAAPVSSCGLRRRSIL